MPLVLSLRNAHPPKYLSLVEAMLLIDDPHQLSASTGRIAKVGVKLLASTFIHARRRKGLRVKNTNIG
jgi:hypothetical protein